MTKFNVFYKVGGNRMTEVVIPDGIQFPPDWHSRTMSQQDEWLYENQLSSRLKYEDIAYGEAVTITQEDGDKQ